MTAAAELRQQIIDCAAGVTPRKHDVLAQVAAERVADLAEREAQGRFDHIPNWYDLLRRRAAGERLDGTERKDLSRAINYVIRGIWKASFAKPISLSAPLPADPYGLTYAETVAEPEQLYHNSGPWEWEPPLAPPEYRVIPGQRFQLVNAGPYLYAHPGKPARVRRVVAVQTPPWNSELEALDRMMRRTWEG